MLPGDSWVSLRVSDRKLNTHSKRPTVFISIPKKVVRLATRRNRIKRLIREAIKKEEFFQDVSKVYFFRLLKLPMGKLNLWEVKKTILSLRGVAS